MNKAHAMQGHEGKKLKKEEWKCMRPECATAAVTAIYMLS
jgi:hypothetical protein